MKYATKKQLIAFEDSIKALWESGDVPCLMHLCGGNEEQLIKIFEDVREGDWIFASHRNHYAALLAGIPPMELGEQITAGNSMFTFSKERNFYSSAILAGCCGIAAGMAFALKRANSANKVICFLGDGAEEQGHFYEAALFVEANDLPCKFIVEDNLIQVETPKKERRGTRYSTNCPLDHFNCVERYHYTPTYPHAGSGTKNKIIFNPEAIKRHREKAQ